MDARTLNSGALASDLARLRRRTSIKWSGFGDSDAAIPAWIAEMDFEVAVPIVEAVTEAVRTSDLGYPDHHSVSLKQAVSRWMTRDFDWPISADDVYVLPDAVRGVELALLAVTNPGDVVVVPTPVYPPLLAAVGDHGRRLVESPYRWTGQTWELDLQQIEDHFAAGARAIIVCNPQNPTGTVLSDAEIQALGVILERYDAYVISDEIHAPLTFLDDRHRPLASVSEALRERTLTVTSTSKAWNTPGLRCGVLLVENKTVRVTLDALPVKLHKGASIVGIVASIAAIDAGGPWLADTRNRLRLNRDYVRDCLAENAPQIRFRTPDATYLAWLGVDAGSSVDLAQVVGDRARVILSDGAAYGQGGAGWVRLNFGTTAPVLEEIMARVVPVLNCLAAGR